MPPEHTDRDERDEEDLEESKNLDSQEENKLASLNEMLKKKQFVIQQEDEEDFEAFLTKLNSKRQMDLEKYAHPAAFPSAIHMDEEEQSSTVKPSRP